MKEGWDGRNGKQNRITRGALRGPFVSIFSIQATNGFPQSTRQRRQWRPLGRLLPDSVALRHGHLLHHQAALRSGAQVRPCGPLPSGRSVALRQACRQVGHELLSGACHGRCGPGGHGQRCGHGHGPRGGRSGLALLALGRGLLRHGNHLRRSRARADLSHEGRAGPRARRSRLLHHARHGREVASACGLLLDRNHHCAGLHRQHGAVQLHRARHADRLQRAGRRLGRRVRGARGPRLLRRKS